MKAEKGKARISAPIIVLLATALVLAFTMISTAQAALDKKTNVYEANLTLSSLDVSLTENGEARADGSTLLENLTDGERFAFGKKYAEDLAAVNEGSQPEYVRVTINKYWLEPNGSVWTKDTSLSPDYIEPGWVSDGWVMADGSKPSRANTTGEQVVLYSVNPLQPGQSLSFMNTLRISPDVLGKAEPEYIDQKVEGGVYYVTTKYKYENREFGIDVEVASVQTHNAADAIKSAWGIDAAKAGINVEEVA